MRFNKDTVCESYPRPSRKESSSVSEEPWKWSAHGKDVEHGARDHQEDDVVAVELLLIALSLTRCF